MNGFLKTAGAVATAVALVTSTMAGKVHAEEANTVKAGVILSIEGIFSSIRRARASRNRAGGGAD